MHSLSGILKRALGLILFFVLCFGAVLYGIGKFDFVFINRNLPISGRGNEEMDIPQISEEDKALEDHVGQLGVGENISDITLPEKNEDADNETNSGEKDSVSTPQNKDVYMPYEDAIAEGYFIDGDSLGDISQFFMAEMLFQNKLTKDQIKGKKNVILDSPKVYEDGGEQFYATSVGEDYRFSVEIYMGYILINDKSTVEVFTTEGKSLGSFGHSELNLVYMRDEFGRPLFSDFEDKLFYLDENGRIIYSDYDDSAFSKGLYFSYSDGFGESDNGILISAVKKTVSFHDELDTSDYYLLSSVDPELAYSIYLLHPSYAEKVARYNPRFRLALEDAKAKIKEEKRLEEEKNNELLTSDTESPKEPDETAPQSDTEGITEKISTLLTEALSPESSTIESTDSESPKESTLESETENGTDLNQTEEITNEIETEGTAPDTIVFDPNILVIDRELELLRYGFDAEGSSDVIDHKYAKAYGFSEGRAAVVDDNGILRFVNENFRVVIDGVGTRMVTSSRYITTEYAEPLYRNSENSKGYLYFDNGLVRVRQLQRDYTYRNLIYSDSDVLLYKDGTEFKIPHGYTLISYSDGVLLLKGQNNKFGYYHKNGYWIAQPIYTELRPFSEGLGVIGFRGGKKGVIDTKGNIVVPFAYEYITALTDGVMAMYSYDGGWRVLLKMAK